MNGSRTPGTPTPARRRSGSDGTRSAALTLALAAGGLALSFAAAPLAGSSFHAAAADEDAGKQARLLYFEGKFAAGDELLAAAPAEIRDDPALRKALAEAAQKWAGRQKGAAKRAGLIAARKNWGELQKLAPTESAAVETALDITRELVEIAREAKNGVHAVNDAGWAISAGENALEGGADSPALRLGLADAYVVRAEYSHKVEDFDQIVSDYTRGAELIAETADASKKPAASYGRAAQILLDLGTFVNDQRPMKEETRDEESITKAVEFATDACRQEDTRTEHYTTHVAVLQVAHRFGIEELPPVFVDEVSERDRVGRLPIHVPRGRQWKQIKDVDGWPLMWERRFLSKEGDPPKDAMQIMLRAMDHGEAFRGRQWSKVEEVAKARFDAEKKKFDDVAAEVVLERVEVEPIEEPDDGKKKRKKKKKKKPAKFPEVWHWEIAGTRGGARQRVGEWLWLSDSKNDVSYNLRMIDYRSPPDLTEPDLVAFVKRAIAAQLAKK